MFNKHFYNNYNKKQLYNLYINATLGEIKDNRFDKIKIALSEIIPLAQYDYDSFGYLLDILFYLPDKALKDIEMGNFTIFYKAFRSHCVGLPETYYYLGNILGGIYANYKEIKDFNTYLWLCNDCMPFLYDYPKYNDQKMNESMNIANPDLAKLLQTTINMTDYSLFKTKKFNIFQLKATTEIKTSLLVTYMMFIDKYNDFTLPVKLFNSILEKIKPSDLITLGEYLRFNQEEHFISKELLNMQQKYQENNDIIIKNIYNSKILKID